jgi:hypothetical protein
MKYLIGALCIIFVIADFSFTINPIIRNVIFGIMSIIAIAYLIMNKGDNGLGSMFKESEKEKKSIFNVKDLFKK